MANFTGENIKNGLIITVCERNGFIFRAYR